MSQTPYYLENPLKTPQRFKNITHSEKTQFNVSIVDEVLQTFLILPSRWMSQRMIKVYFNIGVCGAWLTSDIKGTSDFGLWPWIQFSVTEAAPRCDSSTRSLINLHSFWKVKDDQISGKTISGSVKMQILLVPQSSEMARYFSMRLQDCSSHTGGSRWLGPFFLNSLSVLSGFLHRQKIFNRNQLSANTIWPNYNISWNSGSLVLYQNVYLFVLCHMWMSKFQGRK